MNQDTQTIILPRHLALMIYNEGIHTQQLADIVLIALTKGFEHGDDDVAITLLTRDALKWEEVLKDNSLQVPMETGHRLAEAFVMSGLVPAPEDLRWKLKK